MPILTLPLVADGAVVDLLVGVSEPRRLALVAANQPVPAPVQIRALIDTGASVTCIEDSAIQPLGLIPTGIAQMVTPSTGAAPVACNQYDVSLLLIHPALARLFPAAPIIECKPLSPNFRALLGRDLLAHCLFVYDGQANRFSLAF
jgi:hypothetical protein